MTTRTPPFVRACATSLVIALHWVIPGAARAQAPASDDRALAGNVERAAVARIAVARSPSVRAGVQRAHAMRIAGEAGGRLPAPEAMAQVWQVPLARPYALNEQMIMFGVHQTLPAPGALGAREEAQDQQARVEEIMADDRAREITRDASHAFADYLGATERHRVHREHLLVATRVLDLAQARHETGGPLTDVTQADLELARMEADVITDRTLVDSARARINALLSRDAAAPLGAPIAEGAGVPAWTTAALLAKARATRPEIRAAGAQREARRLEARAADREATWPTLRVGALYFAPTSSAPAHGYGFDAAVSLPWLWGAARKQSEAADASVVAAVTHAGGTRIPVDVEVVSAEANARSAALRLDVLERRALPASRRAFDAAWSGYASARTDALTVLAARRGVVDVESDMVAARSALDHAFADLDAAVGVAVPRRAVAPSETSLVGRSMP
jgi:outer membrane protein, heavy metal efflux system